ncbi:MAG: helix-hairpin-helix domain-containing protein [Desulfatitalea sp.]|nr:helix-hairpin-helix domain-containing protein [Desulfatitalea sp.]
MRKKAMAVVTALTVALMMTWAVPAIAADMGKININTANAEELMTLKGIGESYAKSIIEYRETNGPFQTAEDLMKVKGIGEKTIANNKDRIITADQ